VAVPRTLCEYVVTDRRALFPRPTCPRRVLAAVLPPPRRLVCRDTWDSRRGLSSRPAAGMQESIHVGHAFLMPSTTDLLSRESRAGKETDERERERERERIAETRETSRELRDPPRVSTSSSLSGQSDHVVPIREQEQSECAGGRAPFRICIHEISAACAHVRDDLRRPREISRGQRTRVHPPSLPPSRPRFPLVTDGAGRNWERERETRRAFSWRARATRSYLRERCVSLSRFAETRAFLGESQRDCNVACKLFHSLILPLRRACNVIAVDGARR